MNAVEKLEAAITKLETLKADAKPGPWTIAPPHNIDVDWRCIDSHGGVCLADATVADAELIVTLHRTIDAQLAILRAALAIERVWPIENGGANVVALADAILGGSDD
jgi:hypothetical protein